MLIYPKTKKGVQKDRQATNEVESAAPTINGKILLFFMIYSSFEVCALLTVPIILFTSA